MTGLSPMFDPDRVAVIGATEAEGSVGRALWENLATYEGDVIPVNPERETIFGTECYPEIGAVPDPGSIDLAVVIVPATVVIDVVEAIGEVGIEHVVVVSAGFSEAGPEGEAREQALIEVAEQYDLNLVGPNCLGVLSTRSGLNATFVGADAEPGSISLMSQSGAFISAVLGWASQRGIGLNDVVSLGNEAVMDEVDFVAEWAEDPDSDVILAYLEDIEDGRVFIETAREVTDETPIVILKSGLTESGAEAAASHTGSIAGTAEAYRAAFHQAGVLGAETVQEAFDYSRALAGQPLLDAGEIAIVTNGGGPGVLAADAIDRSGLDLATFGDELRAELADLLPDAAAVENPLDIIGDASLERFRASLDLVLGDPNVAGAIVISVPTALFDFGDLADVVGEVQRAHDKPVVASVMGGEEAERATERLAEYDIPNYFDPANAVPSLEALADQRRVIDREYETPAGFDVETERARSILESAADGGGYLGVEAMELLDAYGISTPAGGLAESQEAAAAIAADIGGPVVLKLASPDIVHKSDVGGVAIDVSPGDVRETYAELLDRAAAHDPDAHVVGVRVEEFVSPPEHTETIVGAKRDAQFGHLLMVGLGGIFVEVYEDTAFRVAPVSRRDAREMTKEIQAAPMLCGARGRTPADIDAVVETIQRVSQLVTDFPAIRELDINPLLVAPEGVTAVDLRVTVADEI